MRKNVDVLIIDNHPVVRQGLTTIIEKEKDFAIQGIANGISEATLLIEKINIDLILIDVALKKSFEFIEKFAKSDKNFRFLVFTFSKNPLHVKRALKIGAKGYLLKDEPIENILKSMRKVIERNIYISEEIRSSSIQLLLKDDPEDSLSSREIEILELLGKGYTTNEIAEKMFISSHTVSTHRSNLKRKLDLSNNNLLIHFAVTWVNAIYCPL